jgi:phenylalanyl-tRNA synthetase beta subunit
MGQVLGVNWVKSEDASTFVVFENVQTLIVTLSLTASYSQHEEQQYHDTRQATLCVIASIANQSRHNAK